MSLNQHQPGEGWTVLRHKAGRLPDLVSGRGPHDRPTADRTKASVLVKVASRKWIRDPPGDECQGGIPVQSDSAEEEKPLKAVPASAVVSRGAERSFLLDGERWWKTGSHRRRMDTMIEILEGLGRRQDRDQSRKRLEERHKVKIPEK